MFLWDKMMNERKIRVANDIYGTKSKITMVMEVDPETYEKQNKFYINNKECQTVTLKSKQAKNFAAHALIKKDLKFVKSAFYNAIELASDEADSKTPIGGVRYRAEFDYDSDILKSLYISGVVTYAKCFTQANGRNVKLDAKSIFGTNESKEKKLHTEVMDLRHSYLAHGGKTKHEQVSPILLLNPEDKTKAPYINYRHRTYSWLV